MILTDEMIEALCLGLTFIPPNPEYVKINEEPVNRLIHSINRAFFFLSKKIKKKSGWLHKFTQSEWTPEDQSWTSDESIIPLIDALKCPTEIEKPVVETRLLDILKTLRKQTTIHITKADKGRNTVIWETSEYDKEALRQLSDSSVYCELSQKEFDEQLQLIKGECCTLSENLLALKHITTAEDETICDRPPQGSDIYFLPKIHKDKQPVSNTFPGRPIVATYSSTPYLLDKYITEITGLLLKLIPGSLLDTQDFIHKLPTGKLDVNSKLITADVTSLYPNIPWQAGIEASTAFYRENFHILTTNAIAIGKLQPPNPVLFRNILELVITNSLITFKKKRFFKQIKGTAMGCCISVYFANCYMYFMTKNIIREPPSWLFTFVRFIDDLFFITTTTDDTKMDGLIKSISNAHIKYEISPASLQQNFLDTTITITCKNLLKIQPYSKTTASSTYLHPLSMHPQHIIRATPYSQLLRIRRISSSLTIYNAHAKIMIKNFLNMGYNERMIKQTHSKIFKLTTAEIALKTETGSAAKAFKLITKYNKKVNRKQVIDNLAKLQQAIISHYEEEGANKNSDYANLMTENKIIHVTSNERNINSFFSPFLKKGLD
jgi:hypothetical protein